MNNYFFKKISVLCLIFLLTVFCACADNQYAGRIIGTLTGAAVGALVSEDHAKGALIGGTAGFLAGWMADKYTAKQIKSAEQARTDAIKENKVLPDGPKLNSYNVALQPASTLKQGSTAKLVSTIDISPWKNNKKAVVKEEVLLTLPDGTQKQWIKPYPELAEGGQWEVAKDINTQALPDGMYNYKTNLYIDDKVSANRQFSFQIVSSGNLYFADAK